MQFQPSIYQVRQLHSIIWLVMATGVFYILFSGVTGMITQLTFAAIGLLVLETFVLLLNNWSCPLTLVAKNVKADWQDGDDIILPKWLAIHNKAIFGTLFVVGVVLVIIRIVSV